MSVHSQAESDAEIKAATMECIITHNQSMEHYKSQAIDKKFSFTYDVLKHSYGTEKADEYMSQKKQALANEPAMDSFFKMIISKITEVCVSAVPEIS